MRYYLISEDWLISPTARNIYRWCAGISFALLPSIVAMHLLSDNGMLTPVLDLFLRAVLFLSVVATSVVCIAMQHFLFVEDESSGWEEIFWFLMLMVLGVGPGLYVFFGYSRSEVFRRKNSTSATG